MKIIIYSTDINLADRYKNSLEEFDYKIIDNYEDLYLEANNKSIIILPNIDCNKEENLEFISLLIDLEFLVIILDSVPSYEKGKKLISLGIKAYGNLMINDLHLKDVIQTVADNNIWLYPEFINELVSKIPYTINSNEIDEQLNILTQREKEVALLVLDKMPYSKISEKLNITLRTVKAHTKNIFDKFEVSNRLSFILKFHK